MMNATKTVIEDSKESSTDTTPVQTENTTSHPSENTGEPVFTSPNPDFGSTTTGGELDSSLYEGSLFLMAHRVFALLNWLFLARK